MSDNIHNTKINLVKDQVYKLIQDIQNGENDISTFETRYNYLYQTSKTLFNLICKESSKPNFNKQRFDNNLNKMLHHILKIQKDELTQNEASEDIGKLLAKQFIPQYRE